MTFDPRTPPAPPAIVNSLFFKAPSYRNLSLGQFFSGVPERSGGTAPFTWSLDTGPANGLAHNTSTGEISGTPSSLTTQKFTQTVTDSSNPPQTMSRTFAVGKAPVAVDNTPVVGGGSGVVAQLRVAALAAMASNTADRASDPSLATITYSSTHNAALSNQRSFGTNQALFKVVGGRAVPKVGATGYYLFPATKIGSAAQVGTNLGAGNTGDGTNPVFTTDGHDNQISPEVSITVEGMPVVELQLYREAANLAATSNTEGLLRSYAFLIDGVYHDRNPTNQSTLPTIHEYVTLDFTGQPNPMAKRTITAIFSSPGGAIAGVSGSPGGAFSRPVALNPTKGAFIADSQVEGQNCSNVKEALGSKCARRFGWSDWVSLAIGTTGWIADGGVRRTFLQQLTDQPIGGAGSGPAPAELLADRDEVAWWGGFNDRGAAATNPTVYNSIVSAVFATLTKARELCPLGRFTIYGPVPGRTGPSQDIIFTERAVVAGVALFNDANTRFIYTCDPAKTTPYSTGTGFRGTGNQVGDGTADTLVSNDGIHLYGPTGGEVYSQRAAADRLLTLQ